MSLLKLSFKSYTGGKRDLDKITRYIVEDIEEELISNLFNLIKNKVNYTEIERQFEANFSVSYRLELYNYAPYHSINFPNIFQLSNSMYDIEIAGYGKEIIIDIDSRMIKFSFGKIYLWSRHESPIDLLVQLTRSELDNSWVDFIQQAIEMLNSFAKNLRARIFDSEGNYYSLVYEAKKITTRL